MTESKGLKYEELALPYYINSREVFAGLTVSDLARASVLGGLNLFLVGDTGTGKSQLASDIYRHWFGGNKAEKGQGVFIRAHPDTNVYEEIFTNLNIERKQRELTDSLEALVCLVEEINRAPPIAQNQFFGLGDGKMDYRGREISLGREGYNLLIATANIGNGEFQGTFETDKAMLNRLHVALDLEYRAFHPTFKDKYKIKTRRKADPNVRLAPIRDISDKIIQVSKEISEATESSDLETQAVLNYLETGLQNCQKYEVKDRVWPMGCQNCSFNQKKEALCSMIKAPTTRTIEVVRKYAAALEYLAKLKNPEIEIEPYELIFKTFELTGAYQHLLNPTNLRAHYNHAPKVMAEAVEKLRQDYESQKDFILASLEEAQKGEKVTRFFSHERKIGNYDGLNEKAREGVTLIEPFRDSREIGLAFVNDLIELTIEGREPEKRGKN
ncbi:AAA family ATPase [Candidatus Pacearchaeota archaeon]|nr:AAA family ATPase [Candidatus Pacearchaeota archaeon]